MSKMSSFVFITDVPSLNISKKSLKDSKLCETHSKCYMPFFYIYHNTKLNNCVKTSYEIRHRLTNFCEIKYFGSRFEGREDQ